MQLISTSSKAILQWGDRTTVLIQFQTGDGAFHCKDCVSGGGGSKSPYSYSFECPERIRTFGRPERTQHSLARSSLTQRSKSHLWRGLLPLRRQRGSACRVGCLLRVVKGPTMVQSNLPLRFAEFDSVKVRGTYAPMIEYGGTKDYGQTPELPYSWEYESPSNRTRLDCIEDTNFCCWSWWDSHFAFAIAIWSRKSVSTDGSKYRCDPWSYPTALSLVSSESFVAGSWVRSSRSSGNNDAVMSWYTISPRAKVVSNVFTNSLSRILLREVSEISFPVYY